MNLAAVQRNCERLERELTGGARLCAVVKADGYGHGAVSCARAALAGGASWLAVADAREARELREAGIAAVPLLVMGALTREEVAEAGAAGADVVVWSERQLEYVREAAGGRVHVKLDSGMGRLGTRDTALATSLAEEAIADPVIEVVGLMTHFATADDLDDGGFFAAQFERFRSWALPLKRRHPHLLLHAANSAALLRAAEAHFDMARCGVSIYGMDPFGRDPGERALEPALELRTHVAEVKPCAPGESTGYGRRFVAAAETSIGILPVGYGDGFRRGLSGNAEALIDGRRRPLVGTVSMDSVAVDLGADGDALGLRGQEAVLIGIQGTERITAEDLARSLGTINYEITCGLTQRIPRRHHRDGAAVQEREGVGGPAAVG